MANKLYEYIETISNKRRFYNWQRELKKKEPKINLTGQQKDLIRNTFFKIPGIPKTSLHAHSYYSNIRNQFSPWYIPDAIWFAYIEPYFNPRIIGKVLDNKTLYNRFFPVSEMDGKHPEIVCYRINGFLVDEDYNPLSLEQLLEKASEQPRIFIKLAQDSAGGQGVQSWTPVEGTERLKEILDLLPGDLVIQKGIKQHPEVAKLNPDSVNTIRVLTMIRPDGDFKILSTVIRTGRTGSIVDNACSGGVLIGIDEKGKLNKEGYDFFGHRYTEHPDTKVKFEEITIPNFDKVKAFVKRLAWMIPQFRMPSWDIAIDESGSPVLVEVNMHSGGVQINQLCNGPVFGDLTKDILQEVFSRK